MGTDGEMRDYTEDLGGLRWWVNMSSWWDVWFQRTNSRLLEAGHEREKPSSNQPTTQITSRLQRLRIRRWWENGNRAIGGAAGTTSRAGCDSLMALKGFIPVKKGLHW